MIDNKQKVEVSVFNWGPCVDKLKMMDDFKQLLLNSSLRFLLNKFYSDFNFKSKNLKVLFSKSENPYI